MKSDNMRKCNYSFHYFSYIMLVLVVYGAALIPLIAQQYSYDWYSKLGAAAGFLIFLMAGLFVLFFGPRNENNRISQPILIGAALGLLWIVEIAINNIIAPPLPMRDIMDNVFWAVIAFLIFSCSSISAYRIGRMRAGILVGAWSGFVSGLMACCMALSVVLFGMEYFVRDPLNIIEWAQRGGDSGVPTLQAYFAYEIFAGAFLHLLVLGILMGIILGALGGLLGNLIHLLDRRLIKSA